MYDKHNPGLASIYHWEIFLEDCEGTIALWMSIETMRETVQLYLLIVMHTFWHQNKHIRFYYTLIDNNGVNYLGPDI